MLLLLYVSVYLFPPGLGPHSEHDHLNHLDYENEKDPCHLAIYHPGSEGSCNHKYHFTKDPGKCPLCDVLLVRQIVNTEKPLATVIFSIASVEIQKAEGHIIQFPISQTDRGPPTSFII